MTVAYLNIPNASRSGRNNKYNCGSNLKIKYGPVVIMGAHCACTAEVRVRFPSGPPTYERLMKKKGNKYCGQDKKPDCMCYVCSPAFRKLKIAQWNALCEKDPEVMNRVRAVARTIPGLEVTKKGNIVIKRKCKRKVKFTGL